jgi:hypothetical protein
LPGIALRKATVITYEASSPMQERMRFSYRWMTWLCLSLMLWTAVAESTHNHPNKTESAACSICVAAHSSAPTATSHRARPVFEAIDLLQEEEVIANARLSVFDLGIRGPPAV